MPAFPSTFPCPAVDPFSMELSAGLVRTAFESGLSRQRRRFKNLPHTMSLRWVLNQKQLGQVIPWLNDNGYSWFELSLPSELAGQQNQSTVPHEVRLISDLACNLIMYDKTDATKCVWELSASVEWMKFASSIRPAGGWVMAGRSAAPSPDWIIGRRPANPSTDIIYSGPLDAPASPLKA